MGKSSTIDAYFKIKAIEIS